MLTFLPIIPLFHSHQLYLLFFAYKNDNNLKVVTIRILAFLIGCILALLETVCSPLKNILAVNIRNLLLGMRLQWTWSKEIASLRRSGHLACSGKYMYTYYASIILDAQKHLLLC